MIEFNVIPDKYQNTDNLMNYSKAKQDYILARLILLRNFIQEDNKPEALHCIDDILTDINSPLDSQY